MDASSRAVHCHACDDWVIAEPPWLVQLRAEPLPEPPPAPEPDSPPSSSSVGVEAVGVETVGKRPTPRAAAGLKNLGNTCYLNATLQALSHLEGFRAFFHDFVKGETRTGSMTLGTAVVARQSTPAWKIQAESQSPEQTLASALHGLLRACWSGRYAVISPHALVHAVWRHTDLFESPQQHDAQEFLGYLLGRLSDELAIPASSVTPLVLPSAINIAPPSIPPLAPAPAAPAAI